MNPTDAIADAASVGIPLIRIEILALLRERPSTISEIEAATGYTRNGLASHLRALLRMGAITCTVERVPGVARPTRRFRLDSERVQSIAWSLYDAFAEPEKDLVS